MIAAHNLAVSYADKCIISDLEFFANPGQFTAIVGPNGSGKTTLLHALSGDIEYSGSATINGHPTNKTGAWRLAENRAVLSQFSAVSFPFTVYEIVQLGILDRAADIKTRAGLVESSLSKVGLSGFASRSYLELSGGEKQRVQLARVLCQVWEPVANNSARWLFLDEPVSSLDIQHQVKIMNVTKDYANRGGGVVAIMHDLNLTAMYADKIYVLKDGVIIASGSPVSVLQNEVLEEAFGCNLKVNLLPEGNTPFVLPHSMEI